MLPVIPFIGAALIYGCFKVAEAGKLRFYSAAMLFTAAWGTVKTFEQWTMGGGVLGYFGVHALVSLASVLVAALVLFWLLECYEDTIAAWLGVFVVGWLVIVFLL